MILFSAVTEVVSVDSIPADKEACERSQADGHLGAGALGVLPPTVSALLHNSSTLLLSMHSLTKLMDEEKTSELERTHTNGNRSIQ